MFLFSHTAHNAVLRLTRHCGLALSLSLCLPLLLAAPHYSEASDCSGTVLLLGDSIGAGYGLESGSSWADMLGRQLQDQGLRWVNASISGETTAGGLRRLDQLLEEHQPRWLILELGGNDGLRGFPIKRMRANLESIAAKAKAAGAQVYILGMQIPPNYGPLYTRQFHASYQLVAEETSSAYLPFLLEGIGGNMEMMQSDGIHPTVEAQSIIFATATSAMPDFCDTSTNGS